VSVWLGRWLPSHWLQVGLGKSGITIFCCCSPGATFSDTWQPGARSPAKTTHHRCSCPAGDGALPAPLAHCVHPRSAAQLHAACCHICSLWAGTIASVCTVCFLGFLCRGPQTLALPDPAVPSTTCAAVCTTLLGVVVILFYSRQQEKHRQPNRGQNTKQHSNRSLISSYHGRQRHQQQGQEHAAQGSDNAAVAALFSLLTEVHPV
jgi:hypothetical protein